MTNKTPIQELIDTILFQNDKEEWYNAFREDKDLSEYVNEALEKERKMVIDAYSSGFSSGKWQTDGNDSIYHAKKYFNHKYGK